MFEEMNAQMQALPQWVGLWLNWMMIVFFASILFVWKRPAARIVLAAFLLTLPVGFLVFSLYPDVDLLGLAHLLIWTPLLVFLWKKEIRVPSFQRTSAYGIWLFLLSATIVVSLTFDVRDVILVAMGQK